jgi:hypothetical protein
MKKRNSASAKRFRGVVACFLDLPVNTGELAVRAALRRKGPRFIEWYDTRLQAIAEFERKTDAPPACGNFLEHGSQH